MKIRNLVLGTPWLGFVVLALAVSSAQCSVAAGKQSADDFTSTPLVVTVENQLALETIGQCVAAVEKKTTRTWSLWIDRHLDRNTTIDLSAVGPTAASVLVSVCEKTGWAIYPVEQILMVGRPVWIDAMLGTGIVDPSPRPDLISVTWPAGSDVRSVLQDVLASKPVADLTIEQTWLPHDVWPAGELRNIDRRTAVSLVLGQFNRRLPTTASLAMIDLNSTTPPSILEPLLDADRKLPSIAISYPTGTTAELIRKTIRIHDSTGRVRLDKGRLVVIASPTAHRHTLLEHWKQFAPAAVGPGSATQTFDLKLINKPAAEVIRHLANAAGKAVRIEPEATLRSERLISLDGKTKTLEQLAQQVATSAELKVTWTTDEVVISLP